MGPGSQEYAFFRVLVIPDQKPVRLDMTFP